jgi:hypothetical protein
LPGTFQSTSFFDGKAALKPAPRMLVDAIGPVDLRDAQIDLIDEVNGKFDCVI